MSSQDILLALWFFAPAGIANASPIFAARIPGLRRWKAPMDMGRSWRGQRIFGANKTWRGLMIGIITATLTLWLQQYLVAQFAWAAELTSQIEYQDLPLLILGPLFGLGALFGDAIESFFKRQHGVAPGHSWFPFDQLDYIIGGAILTLPVVRLTWWQYLWVMVLWLLLHLAASYIGFLLKLKDKPI